MDKEIVIKVAKIARLKLTENEINLFSNEFDEILELFDKISNVKTENVEMAFHPVEIRNRLREDKIESSLSQEDVLKNSKNNKDGYIKGPRVI
ncbi:Asp-tRNA(Asn)/Glu-tRNA(Gln) amidotransferase subunit GatC [Candidatus Woesearchaeota archaeon]|nr:Asp-tRNA(Asn)/Glu-tRNA(Gln) amidotransferase subunit GatC [Candidatus Woesearchaeota archaeon]